MTLGAPPTTLRLPRGAADRAASDLALRCGYVARVILRLGLHCSRVGALLLGTALAALAIPETGTAAADRLPTIEPHEAAADARARRGYRPGRGMFLLAAPGLSDPRFARTVILLLEYDETGALGLVVNRPTEIALSDALSDPLPGAEGHAVFYGGPVEHRRLIALLRSPDAVGDAQHVVGDVYASGSLDTLRQTLDRDRDGGAVDVHTYLGYAGWSPGQLDAEIARGDWVVTPADAGSIFDTPPHRVWHDLMRRNAGRWVRAAPRDWRGEA